MKETNVREYEDFKLKIYQWSISLLRGRKDEVLQSLRDYLPKFLGFFEKKLRYAKTFVEGEHKNSGAVGIATATVDEVLPENGDNLVNFHGFDIEVTTVHSAKGQTHTATLYLDTYYNRGYESSRLSDQFKLDPIKGDEAIRIKQSAKMCYVGMSRPTHLLCVAIHKSRFDKHLNNLSKEKWEIVTLQ